MNREYNNAEEERVTVDLGASGGRCIVFEYDGDSIVPAYEHRFENGIVSLGGTDYWDFLHLFKNIKHAIRDAATRFDISSIGIDAWGLDFGLVDSGGILMENPVSYRDKRTVGMPETLDKLIPRKELYYMTGTQCMQENTVYQIYFLLQNRPEVIERADRLLMTPDLLTYFLTGEAHSEFTIASTAQLMDMRTADWNAELLGKIGLPAEKLPGMIFPGEQAFQLSKDVRGELGAGAIPIVTVASHDSASAVVPIPFENDKSLYISSGTWSILGLETDKPLVNEISYKYNIANEGGFGRTITHTRNLIGLWLVQECVRCWREEGTEISYAQMGELAKDAEPFAFLFDPEEDVLHEKCDMPAEIAGLCRANGLKTPETAGDFARGIYESMALNYRRAIDVLCEETGIGFTNIHVVGGGSKAGFLNQCIADATGLRVVAGPGEATALGNAFAQLYWSGDIASLSEFRQLILNTHDDITVFEPQSCGGWGEAYARFLKL